MLEADFVIIGSGSAGSAMAYRLSEDGKHSVIVIEFGGTDIGPLIQMPSALSIPLNMSLYDWGFASEPEPHLGGRVLATPRGKVIGGSSSINGMVYVRGHARDFDHWAEQGAAGWGFADVLPYFKRMEDSARRRGWLARQPRAAARAARIATQSALRRLRRGRPPGRVRTDRRLQRLEAGRLRADGADHSPRPPLVGGERLSAAGAEAEECQSGQGLCAAGDHRESTRSRRRDRSSQTDSSRQGAA